MSVNAVKKIRDVTGATIMDSKKALAMTCGDIEKAVHLINRGEHNKSRSPLSRSSKILKEGVVLTGTSLSNVVMIEVNCETDFVARSKEFVDFAKSVIGLSLSNNVLTKEDLMLLVLPSFNQNVADRCESLSSIVKENICISRFVQISSTIIGSKLFSYNHHNRIGVILDITCNGDDNISNDIAMHIAAMSPLAISADLIPSSIIESKKSYFMRKAEGTGKSADIIKKIYNNSTNDFLKQSSLLTQCFVKDSKQQVGQVLKTNNAVVNSFFRFEVGKGI